MSLRACRWMATAFLALAPTATSAFPGQLDTTFGTNGVVTTQLTLTGFQASSGGAAGVVRQPDGKLVLAGSTGGFSQPSRFVVIRYNADGTIDRSFGYEGRVNGGPPVAHASGVLLDADGRIVVVGAARDDPLGPARFALARFLPDGSPDASFGTAGVVTTALSGDSSSASAARLDTNGRIVVVGQTGSMTGLVSAAAVVRYTASGALDATFGQAGFVTIAYPTFTGGANDVAIDAGGHIVVAGTGGTSPVLNRLNADGSFDTSFGGTGQVVLPTVGSANAVAIDASGRIVVAGAAFGTGGPPPEMAVMRVSEAGVLDAAFGSAGFAFTGFGPGGSATAVRVDAAGRILVAGGTGAQIPWLANPAAFARFLDNGTLDASYGTDGRVSLSGPAVSDLAPGDSGSHYWAGAPGGGELALGSLLDSGTPNPAFNGGNFVSVPTTIVSIPVIDPTWNALGLAAGGKLVAAGRAFGQSGELLLVSRRLADGAADTSFAGSGLINLQVAGSSSGAHAVAVDGSDRVVVAGDSANPTYRRFALVRFLPDGQRDPAFGAAGEVLTSFGSATDSSGATALAIDAGGRLVAGGFAYGNMGVAGSVRLALARYLADGSLDPAFGTGGKVDVPAGPGLAGIQAIALDANGRIVAVGDANSPGGSPFLARLTSTGALDASFGTGGVVALDGPGALGATGSALAVAIDPAGRIVVGGTPPSAPGISVSAIRILRFDDSGQPDAAFGTAGGQSVILAGIGVVVRAVAVDASGRIVAVADDSQSVFMVRLASDGSPDTSFGIGSVMSTAIGGQGPQARAMRLLLDGRAVVAGRAGSGAGAVIARFAMASPPGMQPVSIVRNGAGNVTSSLAGLDCGSSCIADVPTGTTVTLTATASAGWRFDGWDGDCSGAGSCMVTADAPRSVIAKFSQVLVTIGRFANLSTRMKVLTDDYVLIGGFVIGGDTPRTVVVRARGPSLSPFGLPDTLPNPKIDLYSGQTVIASNDDWAAGPDAAAIQAAGLDPPNANEATLRATLAPGGYTAIVRGVASPAGTPVTGTGIVEIFNPDPSDGALINISTRGLVQTGNDVMIAGFVIQGADPQTVVVRARGPSLALFGITSHLLNPLLQVFAGQTEIARNDNWQSGGSASQVLALGLQPPDFRESAVYLTLAPGAYTAIVSGLSGSPGGGAQASGVALVEVFAVTPLPPPPP